MSRKTVVLDIVSDVMCPWCYIGKRRLEAAMALAPDVDLDVRWRPFQLDATIPPEGMDRQEYLDRKFGPQKAKQFYAQIKDTGTDEGIDFDFPAIDISPNTIDAHRLIRWAATAGHQDAVVERLFELFFTQGVHIGKRDVLVIVARDCGMDHELVAELLDSDKDVDLVEREIALAQTMGVQGVPAFIFDNTYLVSGAQSADVLADVANKAAGAQTDIEKKELWS